MPYLRRALPPSICLQPPVRLLPRAPPFPLPRRLGFPLPVPVLAPPGGLGALVPVRSPSTGGPGADVPRHPCSLPGGSGTHRALRCLPAPVLVHPAVPTPSPATLVPAVRSDVRSPSAGPGAGAPRRPCSLPRWLWYPFTPVSTTLFLALIVSCFVFWFDCCGRSHWFDYCGWHSLRLQCGLRC